MFCIFRIYIHYLNESNFLYFMDHAILMKLFEHALRVGVCDIICSPNFKRTCITLYILTWSGLARGFTEAKYVRISILLIVLTLNAFTKPLEKAVYLNLRIHTFTFSVHVYVYWSSYMLTSNIFQSSGQKLWIDKKYLLYIFCIKIFRILIHHYLNHTIIISSKSYFCVLNNTVQYFVSI